MLNTATGEPRANETVTVSISLSNSANEVFYSETKSATTNDFGVLSLSVGNADTFKEVDFTKMPFYIEVTANGVSIGKSQILSVPIAEYAKKTGVLTKEILVGTWIYDVTTCELYNDSYKKTDSEGKEKRIKFSYKRYTRTIYKLQFYENGNFTCILDENYEWSEGYIGNEGVPHEFNHHWDGEERTSQYYIDGNDIRVFYNYPESIVQTLSSPTHVMRFSYYSEKNLLDFSGRLFIKQ